MWPIVAVSMVIHVAVVGVVTAVVGVVIAVADVV